MNWLRDNILKVVLIVFALIVLLVIIVACSMGGSTTGSTSGDYVLMENKLQDAAIKYVKDHPSILPKSTDTIKKVKLDTLISNEKIGKLYAVEDKSVACSGQVEIEKISEDAKEYRYTPYIKCGKYYVTKTISDYIIDKETNNGEFERTADDGLYKVGDEYIYRGEYPDNFIYLGNRLYRIIKIDSDKLLKLISVKPTQGYYRWDDRYNISENYNVGINNFVKSRLFESLSFIYENTDEEKGEIFFSDTEKSYIVEHDFCVGKRYLEDNDKNSNVECNETIPMKVGLISLSDYSIASIDSNCKGIFDRSCTNYNYFSSLNNDDDNYYVTMTAVANDTFSIFVIDYNVIDTNQTLTVSNLYPVIYINPKTIYQSGTGTYLDPYVVR